MDLTRPTIDGLMRRLDEMEKEIARLKRGNPLVGQIPAGAGIEVVDPNDGSTLVKLGEITGGALGAEFSDAGGTRVVQIGQLSAGSGIMVGNDPTASSADTFLLIRDDGLVYPWLGHAWTKANDNVVVTSGSYVTTWQVQVELSVGNQIRAQVTVQCPVGTTADFYLEHFNSGLTTSPVSVGSGVTKTQTFIWDLDTDLVPGSGPHIFNLKVRRVSGAGNVFSYVPYELINATLLGGTATGV